MKRSFASLNPQEALHVAIFIEERNAELYHQFADMFIEFADSESLEIADSLSGDDGRRKRPQLEAAKPCTWSASGRPVAR